MTMTIPKAPVFTSVFGDNVNVFSTCRDCGELMVVLDPYVKVHPCCNDKPTKAEAYTSQWIAALCRDEKSVAAVLKRKIERLDAEPPDLCSAAMSYAEMGWPVFPLANQSKAPAIKGGKGFHDANTDVARLEKWWTRHPSHNIGLASGRAFDVIDIDPRNGGVTSFMEVLSAGRLPDVHGIAVTASGGMHLYVIPKRIRCFPGMEQGIDYKALGGYVVAPPSTLGGKGRDYSWLTVPSPMLKGDNGIE
jgi:Bifunctional DNA primase/polymerase, N-terminal